MQLKRAWDTAAKTADKTKGAPDVDLGPHLRATKQQHLPQAELLQGCFDLLKDKGLIEEAYLRGSIGRGHADIHSDVDLFTVIAPENLDKVYDTVSGYLASQGRIVTHCHDRLVENYGGIGFMFIAQSDKHDHKTFQFDLYMAMKGVPPRNPLSIKPRIYAKDPAGPRWIDQHGTKAIELPPEAKSFIARHTAGTSKEDRMELLMQEMLITLYVTNKHIGRGQISRTVNDNKEVVSSAIEFLQLLTDYRPTGYAPLAIGDEIVRFAKKNGDAEMAEAAGALEKLFTQGMSQQKLADALSYSANVFKKAFPERYEKQREAIEFFEKHLINTPAEPANDTGKKPGGAKPAKTCHPRRSRDPHKSRKPHLS